MFGEHGRKFLRQRLKFVVGMRTEQVVHHRSNLIEQRTTLFKRQYGIFKRRRLGVRNNRLNLSHLFGNALTNGGGEVLVADEVERR